MGKLLATVASNVTGPCLAVLDAYFAAAPMFAMAKALRRKLVKDGKETFILICSHLTMAPEEIVSLYSKRFKIQITFKMFKHVIGGFCYHFWMMAWHVPKDELFTLEQLKNMAEKNQRLLADAMNAIETFVNFAMIAIGSLQMLAIEQAKEIQLRHRWWMRNYSSEVPSEEMVKRVLQHEFYHDFRKFKHTAVYRIIQDKRLQSTAVPLKEAA